MLSNNNLPAATTGSSGESILLDLTSFALSAETLQQPRPTCIVVGCKNGHTSPLVKYYQVPELNQHDLSDNSSSIARQWYINTLREDLYDHLIHKIKHNIVVSPLQSASAAAAAPLPHFVCIEHFDEESFVLTNHLNTDNQDQQRQQQIMILKEDAVPSLFEIEVFQKMIAHQEQIALNQQKQQQQQQQFNQTKPNTSFLSNLIFQNEFSQNSIIQQQQQQKIPVQNLASKQTSAPSGNTNSSGNKRVRMDPETRAALIQRVPKAVKRTSLLMIPQAQQLHQQQLLQQQQQRPPSPQVNRPQKAVKHTMPRAVLEQQQHRLSTNSQSSLSPSRSCDSPVSSTQRMPKAVKHTSANILLKEMLPPPIMQSTKRTGVNKAIKHTGGGSTAYYQNKAAPLASQSSAPGQSVVQLSVSCLKSEAAELPTAKPAQTPTVSTIPASSSNNNNNKIAMTTTYVYKKVTQEPEIDLALECEEEEIVFISPPPTPPPPPQPQTQPQSQPTESSKNESEPVKLSLDEASKEDIEIIEEETEKTSSLEPEKVDVSDTSKKKILLKKSPFKVEVSGKKVLDLTEAKIATATTLKKKPIAKITAAKSSSLSSTKIEEETIHETIEEKLISESFEKPKQAAVAASPTGYSSLLAKFYARKHGSIHELDSEKKNKANQQLPYDLRVGNYPAKCNVCDLVLDDNIELTSHICSHLEGGGNSGEPGDLMNTYISPFDAVTTTCGVCDTTFAQPFDLIKHLDQKHMKQLGEYKCRICERQHSKLSDLMAHLNSTHVHQEMPYRCDACGFRTSFYADAIYHIKKEHKSTLRHFCPYCLKSLALPYHEKLGHVQCQLFYSHLITHFNKHENDVLMPSKCKHCHKCILHVRFMKEHLLTDHCSHAAKPVVTVAPTKAQTSSLFEAKVKKEMIVSKESKLLDKRKSEAVSVGLNVKKRRRSNNASLLEERDEVEVKIECDNDEDEEVLVESGKEVEIQDDLMRKLTPKIRGHHKKSTSSISITRTGPKLSESLSKKTHFNIESDAHLSDTPQQQQQQQQQPPPPPSQTQLVALPNSPLPFKRKQLALKQTNVKKLPHQHRGRPIPDDASAVNRSRSTSPTNHHNNQRSNAPEVINAVLAGNLKFSYYKNQFKCAECGSTDLRTHFKNDYTCHQCRYNTNCSNSFEYHLHGHLVSKRQALWNKVIKIKTEEYQCACGFYINSSKDNKDNADTGNKVAAHLMKCEYKYCQVKISGEEEEEENKEEKALVFVQAESDYAQIKSEIQPIG